MPGTAVYAQPAVTAAPPSSQGEGAGGVYRKLILLRHADSDSPANVRDHDRPISDKGKQEAAEIAQKLIEAGWIPDMVLASNAKRTKQTLDEMGNVIESLGDVDAHLYGSLYTVAALDGQTRQHIEECLLEVVDDAKNYCVMCVGHNKGMEEAASSFAKQAVKLKTASAALLQCAAASWADVLRPHAAGVSPSSSVGSIDDADCEVAVWHLVDVITPSGAGA
eukprot:CAMPEP_0202905084 /NCGR_PEP_ID=MMETSP1392-20130828/32444_1 /ASSEMBLY_ACC=CAM_ASM_000868 /TAXON_ID=225041 /ORGANISM="Chlamydomonas chlamydogama, Strain SAG 11-48b" /LENGTH=221 /DNA_ID=CAMNT_0049593019 /DNA_START=204 /DNA_END=869 /DNA_ORIENTATION=-